MIVKNPGLDESEEQWKNIPLINYNGHIIRLGDVATRRVVQQQPRSYFRINGLNTVNINIYTEESANQIAAADRLALTISQLAANIPHGISLEKMFDSTEFLRNELKKTFHRAMAAIVILFVFVFIVLRNLRYLMMILLCLAANLAIAVILYYFLGVEIHLVSIAGITVSLSIIIDNFIMMSNYLMQQRSMRGFTAILGSTLTTLGALIVIFFLSEQQRGTLIDFAMVVIINLSVSLAIALFFIPALVNRLQMQNHTFSAFRKQKKLVLRLNRFYAIYILRIRRWSWAMALAAMLVFGLPFFLLPDNIKSDSIAALAYNKTLGSEFYRGKLKPTVDKWAGGTMRLFVQNSLNKFAGFREAQETILYINISLPKGTTILQMNELCISLEKFLAGFEGISQYQTNVHGPQSASVLVYFTKEVQQTYIPDRVKARMIEKAIEYNGADFSIYMRNDGFSNALSESWRQNRIILSGYNYRELLHLAHSTRDTLVQMPRIQNIAIFSGDAGRRRMSTEEQINIETDKQILAAYGGFYFRLTNELMKRSANPQQAGIIRYKGRQIPVRLVSNYAVEGDIWQFMHIPVLADSSMIKLSETSIISTVRTDGSIYKKDQSYMVTIAYDYIGSDHLAKRILEREVLKLNQQLPLGYKAEIPGYDYSWLFNRQKANYWLIGLVILVIWAICAVIFESVLQPFAVISAIPLSFIGVFLTFYLFDVPFDQGGYAAFILLSGIVVNMSIYIFNDINHLRKNSGLNPMAVYLKAFNIKIIPLLLSAMVTMLALTPFIIFDKGAVFWYALAVGTIGGLAISIPLLLLYLPLLVKFNTTKTRQPKIHGLI